MKIIKITNQDKEFYPLLGPYLANRDIEKAIGYQLYDDPGKVWVIAKNGRNVIGFCYLWQITKNHWDIGSCYAPKNGGVFALMLDAAVDVIGFITITTKKEEFMAVLKDKGFMVKRELKNFTEYEKELKNEESSL